MSERKLYGMPEHELLAVLDFGGKLNEQIAVCVRGVGVYSEVYPYNVSPERIKKQSLRGIILAGGPHSVYEADAPLCPAWVFELGVPVLGICYGAELIAKMFGGEVRHSSEVEGAGDGEFGRYPLNIAQAHSGIGLSVLFEGVPQFADCHMTHSDFVTTLPDGFRATAHTELCCNAAFEDASRRIFAVQFHPEISAPTFADTIFRNFLARICGFKCDWSIKGFISDLIEQIRGRVRDKKVLLALSGGVDSTVLAALLNRAIGRQLICIFVDHGLLRKDEAAQVESVCTEKFDINFMKVDASDRFLSKLAGITDPEQKRKIVGEEFIRVFEDTAKEAKKSSGAIEILAQGTIYPDIIESGIGGAALVKSHHNVGGLPKDIGFSDILEPLRLLFKNEVRQVGTELGLPPEIVRRQPFPGPGLCVRVLGEVTRDKLALLREADAIFREELEAAGLNENISQYFAVLTGIRAVGVRNEERSVEHVIALRAVSTKDFMSADFSHIPYDVLARVSSRITDEVPGINRVVYDITPKPPATIEWE